MLFTISLFSNNIVMTVNLLCYRDMSKTMRKCEIIFVFFDKGFRDRRVPRPSPSRWNLIINQIMYTLVYMSFMYDVVFSYVPFNYNLSSDGCFIFPFLLITMDLFSCAVNLHTSFVIYISTQKWDMFKRRLY